LIARATAAVWRVITYNATQQLWLLRNATAFNDTQPTRSEHRALVGATVTNQLAALATNLLHTPKTREYGAVVEIIRRRIQHEPEHDDQPARTVRMSFDGGSRGNPGHTGAGSVIMEASDGAEWNIVWWDAHYMGDTYTNNEAEHTSLLRGVTECARRYAGTQTQIQIVGDSQLILDQAAGAAHCHKHALRATCRQTQDGYPRTRCTTPPEPATRWRIS
jgi:ribonuclease HI